MILLSLVLVLVSLGLLIAGLSGASQALVWASILSSVFAGACLAIAALQRRAAPDDSERPAVAPDAGDGATTRVPAGGTAAAGPAPATDPTADGGATTAPAGEKVAGAAAAGAAAAGAAASGAAASGAAASGATAAGAVSPPAADVDEVTAAVAVPPGAGAGAGAAEGDREERSAGVAERDDAYPDPPDEPPEEDVSAPDALRMIDIDSDVYVVDGRPRYHLEDCTHLTDRAVVPLPIPEAREAGFTPCSLCKPDSELAAQARKAAARSPAKPDPAKPDPVKTDPANTDAPDAAPAADTAPAADAAPAADTAKDTTRR